MQSVNPKPQPARLFPRTAVRTFTWLLPCARQTRSSCCSCCCASLIFGRRTGKDPCCQSARRNLAFKTVSSPAADDTEGEAEPVSTTDDFRQLSVLPANSASETDLTLTLHMQPTCHGTPGPHKPAISGGERWEDLALCTHSPASTQPGCTHTDSAPRCWSCRLGFHPSPYSTPPFFFLITLMQEALHSLTTKRLFIASGLNSALLRFLLLYVKIKFVTECEQQSACSSFVSSPLPA